MTAKERRLWRLYDQVYSSPPDSQERCRILDKLNDEDRHDLAELTIAVINRKTKHPGTSALEQWDGDETTAMTYEMYQGLMESETNKLLELSAFARKYPEKYNAYSARYRGEMERKRQRHK